MQHKQKGSSLLFTLMVLVAMLFGTISLFKSVDMGTVIAGNLAFKESSVNAADIAIKDAFTKLSTMVDTETDVTNPYYYYHIQRKTTPDGIPCSLKYDVPDSTSTCSNSNMTWSTVVNVGINKVSYQIDRLCKDTPDPDPTGNCLVEQQYAASGNGVGDGSSGGNRDAVFYRVTVKIVGANNTESYVQVSIPKS